MGNAEVGGSKMGFALEQCWDDLGNSINDEEFDFDILPQILGKQFHQIIFQTGKFIIAIDVIGVGAVMRNYHQFSAVLRRWKDAALHSRANVEFQYTVLLYRGFIPHPNPHQQIEEKR